MHFSKKKAFFDNNVRHFGCAILKIKKPALDSKSGTPKTPRAHFLRRLEHLKKNRPPYLIRHFVFRKTDSRFGISVPELVQAATFFTLLALFHAEMIFDRLNLAAGP